MLSGVPDLPESAAASVDVLLMKGAGRPTDLLQAIAKLVQRAHGATDSATAATSRPMSKLGQLKVRAKRLETSELILKTDASHG